MSTERGSPRGRHNRTKKELTGSFFDAEGEKRMIYVEPDFYEKFQCKAERCRHSCCVGWEIDIDGETAEIYESLEGEIGEKLRRSMSRGPERSFLLTEDEPCPFLNERGLCELILTLGEESLCNICREHPRFYNAFPEREERGLGLCCEEAAHLLLEGREPLRLIISGDGERETPELITLRGEILALLAEPGRPLTEKMKSACRRMGTAPPVPDFEHWRKFYLTLERLDDEWTEKLMSARGDGAAEGIACERIAEYFIFRHFASAEDRGEAARRLKFCCLSAWFIAALGGDTEETTRMYSAEIEYSDENMEKIMDEIDALA